MSEARPGHGQKVGGVPTQPGNPKRRAFHAASPAIVARYWWSELDHGLSPEEVGKRLTRLGPNRLASRPPPSTIVLFFRQLRDATVLALLASAAIAALLGLLLPEPGADFLGRYGDSLAILLIVVLNAILGLVQGKRAEKALAALREMTAPVARVIRDGVTGEHPASELVPGDVVLLEEGDKVPADLRLVTSADLELEEATLTGESTAVHKDASLTLDPAAPLADRVNMAYMGTKVTRGRARGVVCNTGMHTELGSIAGMLASVEEEQTPLQQQLDHFGKQIVLACVAVSLVVFAAGWLVSGQSPRGMFLVAVSLAVAAIPEGLPAITTIVLALGTQRMARRNALVRRLPAVETLGSAQIICTDKTGTLTQNAMTARRVWTDGRTYEVGGGGRTSSGELSHDGTSVSLELHPSLNLAVHVAAHASGARLAGTPDQIEVSGDSTDAALLVLAWKAKGHQHQLVQRAEVPFTSSRRMATVIAEEDGQPIAYLRGAPEAIVALAQLSAEDKQEIHAIAAAWGREAMRVVALAVRRHAPSEAGGEPTSWERELTFVALVGIVDPPRPEVKTAMAAAAHAGVRSLMITGDHPATARAIAGELGMAGPDDLVLSGSQLDEMSDDQLREQVHQVRVVARATAEHKLRIVEALKARGIVCAMTGDGVNDAPAVKSAHIGVAMGKTGTEVTKEAADLVLADDNYATIVAAIEEGRAIYANIRKFIYFLLSSNAGIVLTVLVSSLLGWPAPLTPIQILWINLVTNGLPALALGVDPKDADVMNRPPRPTGGSLFPAKDWWSMLGVGVAMSAMALAAFHSTGDLATGRTLAFAVLALAPMSHALNCRSSSLSIFQVGLFTNRVLWGAIAVGGALVAAAIFVPALRPIFKTTTISVSEFALVTGMAVMPLVLGELLKAVRRGAHPSHVEA